MSSFPLLRLDNSFDPCINGDVSIAPSAVIAPGVILQAAANSKIIIGSGVCVGMGSILQVSEGIIEIEAGANLGAGFLMIGSGKIGANSCIGAATTIFNCSVAPEQVIPAGSIFGDTSRQVGDTPQILASIDHPPEVTENNKVAIAAFVELQQQPDPPDPPHPVPPPDADLSATPTETTQLEQDTPHSFGAQIYGQGSIQRLLITLFPHRQSLSGPNSDHQPE
jgi:carbon dioxide concentrating mechanism protein CcmN